MITVRDYLENYWIKYPKEKETDPSLEDVLAYIEAGGQYHLTKDSLILYSKQPTHAVILMYWCDMGDSELKTVARTLRAHKQFMRQFNIPVYSTDVKPLFQRNYLVRQENTLWRWL